MSSIDMKGSVLNTPFDSFAKSLLPLYTGPEVTIRIGSASQEYKLPRDLLCKQSQYFAAMFLGDFKEGHGQSTTLEEIDGVVSTRSFEMLAQWVCIGRIIFKDSPLAEAIDTSIEFARLADMCGITGVESLMAEHIKSIILADAEPRRAGHLNGHNANTCSITTQHIKSAALLPSAHPVRGILAMASVEEYFLVDDYKFLNETQEIPSFAADLLAAVKLTSKTIIHGKYYPEFKEPISGRMLTLSLKQINETKQVQMFSV